MRLEHPPYFSTSKIEAVREKFMVAWEREVVVVVEVVVERKRMPLSSSEKELPTELGTNVFNQRGR